MEELQRPQRAPGDLSPASKSDGSRDLMKPPFTPASEFFVQLLDYSTDLDGEPGHDVFDGRLYIVMELGHQSLKEYLDLHRERREAPSAEAVKSLARSIA